MTDPEYDVLAPFYESWSRADPAYLPTHDFYVALCMTEPGLVVELGVGTGRIAMDILKHGKYLIGIDISSAMLAQCAVHAEELGVAGLLTLVKDDVRTFTLRTPASLITFPFRSIGHLMTWEDKVALLKNVRRNLRPGGRFIFDHYILDENWARGCHGIPHLMSQEILLDGTKRLVWDIYLFDLSTQYMKCYIVEELLDVQGLSTSRTYHPLSFTWLTPSDVRVLANEAGLNPVALYGDFTYGPFTDSSEQQVWILQRPH